MPKTFIMKNPRKLMLIIDFLFVFVLSMCWQWLKENKCMWISKWSNSFVFGQLFFLQSDHNLLKLSFVDFYSRIDTCSISLNVSALSQFILFSRTKNRVRTDSKYTCVNVFFYFINCIHSNFSTHALSW